MKVSYTKTKEDKAPKKVQLSSSWFLQFPLRNFRDYASHTFSPLLQKIGCGEW